MSKNIVFVDPLASTEFLASSLKEAGLNVIAVYTLNALKNNYISIQPHLFHHCFQLNNLNELNDIIEKLRKLDIARVYYGIEISVSIADKIANSICPRYANSPSISAWRSDKYEMQEAIRNAGLPTVLQMKVTGQLTSMQENELISWNTPVIIKPVNSSAAVGVLYCNTMQKIKAYLNKQSVTNIFGQKITDIVIQEYLQGDEYFIDTFSEEGVTEISGVQRYQRKLYRNRPLCSYSEVVDPRSSNAIVCINYVKQVLKGLKLHNGFAHTEVMLTSKGPYLIEVNPRISGAGGLNNKLFRLCGLPSQVDLLINKHSTNLKQNTDPLLAGRKVILYGNKKRIINNLNLTVLATLPSFIEARMFKKPGSTVSYPKNLTDSVAMILLVNPNKQQLIEDYNQIKKWENDQKLF